MWGGLVGGRSWCLSPLPFSERAEECLATYLEDHTHFSRIPGWMPFLELCFQKFFMFTSPVFWSMLRGFNLASQALVIFFQDGKNKDTNLKSWLTKGHREKGKAFAVILYNIWVRLRWCEGEISDPSPSLCSKPALTLCCACLQRPPTPSFQHRWSPPTPPTTR